MSPSSDDFPWTGPGCSSIGEDDADDKEMEWEELLQRDSQFSDVVRLVEGLLKRAKGALENTVQSEEGRMGGKVLSPFVLAQEDQSDLEESETDTSRDDNTTDADGEGNESGMMTELSRSLSSSPELSRHISSLSAID